MQTEEETRLDKITRELEKTIEIMRTTQTTMFYVLEEKRRMMNVLFMYAEGLNDNGEAARKILNNER